MPTTSNKGLSVQTAGSNAGTWGVGASTALNEGVIEVLDKNLGGITSLSLSSSNVALSSSDTQNGMIRMSGTLTANVVVSPDTGVLMTGFYYWENLTSGSYSVTLTNSAGSVALPQSRRGVVWIDTTNGPRIVSIVGSSAADPIPVGTVMLFYQTAAPTGWTQVVSLNDYAMKIVSATGGITLGSVSYSTVFGYTETGSHTLTTSEIPSHQHGQNDGTLYNNTPTTSSGTLTPGANTFYLDTARQTEATGGGNGHTHPLDMRVQTATIILGTKN